MFNEKRTWIDRLILKSFVKILEENWLKILNLFEQVEVITWNADSRCKKKKGTKETSTVYTKVRTSLGQPVDFGCRPSNAHNVK